MIWFSHSSELCNVCCTPLEDATMQTVCDRCSECFMIQCDTEQFLPKGIENDSAARFVAYYFLDNLYFPFWWN